MDLPTQIEIRLAKLGVRASDVRERFVLGTGCGGQKINKTASMVTLYHRPTGTEVRRQKERSREANRRLAWEGLCEKLEKRVLLARAIARSEQEKERRRNRPKLARRKRIMVADKRRRGEVKSTRARVRDH